MSWFTRSEGVQQVSMAASSSRSESGSDSDQSFGVSRGSYRDMTAWCSNVEAELTLETVA